MAIGKTLAPVISAVAIATFAGISTATPALADPEDGQHSVTFEVFGEGTALTIDTDPAGPERVYDSPLPWTDSITIDSSVTLLQVVAVGKDNPNPGCRIIVDGSVVVEVAPDGSGQCVYSF